MIIRDRRFLSALALTFLQQVFLAISTYYIAQAGSGLEGRNISRILFHTSLFFAFALLAYAASSAATFSSTRATNHIWKNYVNSTLKASTQSLQYASDKNKKSISQWLNAEATSTISDACAFYIGLASASLNITLTLMVFYIALDWKITTAMAASLAISLISIMILRHEIEKSAKEMQHRRLGAFLSIELSWNSAMFGSRNMRDIGFRKLDEKIDLYFSEINKYVALEQAIACLPIIISTLAIIGLLQISDLFTLSTAGALVAILPRSLQMLGSVHSLSVYFSQFFLIRSKLRNLIGFHSKLERYHLMHEASLQGISACETATAQNISPAALLAKLHQGELLTGRFRVTGKNGSGKSSFLKIIKDTVADALLMTPETHFLEGTSALSTGQARIKEIENILSAPPPVLMLDEWDANLDDDNCRKMEQLLDDAAKQVVVIEVRHLRQGQLPSP